MADINKFNAWSSNLIDEFHGMVQKHHLSLDNFCRVGTMLEAAGKIYGFRVDSVHAEVIRMSSGIRRESLGQSFMDSTATSDLPADISAQYIQPIRRRRLACATVVGNGDSINAPLQILEELKCPLDRMIGTDEISARSLFQQVLCSDRYAWTLQSNHKFWMDRNVVNGLDGFNELDVANVDLSVLNWIPSIADVVRPRLCGYQLANTPRDHFRYFESFTTVTLNRPDLQIIHQPVDLDIDVPLTTASLNHPDVEHNYQPVNVCDDHVPLSNFDPASPNNLELPVPTIGVPLSTATLNQPDLEGNDVDMDLHFDIDVNPAPVNNSERTMPEIGVSFDEDDRNALRRCSVLRPNTSVADDLRPLTSTPLSYSYRRLSDVPLSTDAGHWTLPSIMHSSSEERATTRRRRRRKIVKKDEPVLLTHAPSDSVEQNFMSVDDSRTKSIRKSHQDKWKLTNLTMPSRMGHSTAVNFLPLMLGCEREPTEETASDAVIDSVRDNEAEFQADDVDEGMEVDMDPVVVTPANISVDTDVEMSIEGAPPNVDHVYAIVPPMPQTPFPITRPNVNVKAITKQCLEIICALEAAGGEPTFGEVYRQLEADGETRTPALVFSSILELANRNNFRLEKIGDTNDFVIKRI